MFGNELLDPVMHKLHVNEAFFTSFTEERLAEEVAGRAMFFKIGSIKYGMKRLKISENI